MWLAIVILTIVNSAGWFLYGISCGEKDRRAMLDKLPPPKPYQFHSPRKLDI